jgi:hypothetical protein
MPDQTRIVGPGPSDRTVRTTDGQILHAPADWELLSPGDATLTRRVKAAGPTWTIQVKKGRRTFSRGVWAPTDRIAMIRADLEAERSTDTLGNKDEVGGYELSGKVQIHWLPDGDHSFKPRKASGRTLEENWRGGVEAVTDFVRMLSHR